MQGPTPESSSAAAGLALRAHTVLPSSAPLGSPAGCRGSSETQKSHSEGWLKCFFLQEYNGAEAVRCFTIKKPTGPGWFFRSGYAMVH